MSDHRQQPDPSAPFQLGEWRVEPARRRVLRGDDVRVLEPKSLAVLQCLIAASGEPVSRDALVEAAWHGRIVTDDAINRQLSKLRQALDDDPRAPRYIETIPKTGFRLLLAPQALDDRPGEPALHPWWALAASVGLVAVITVVLWPKQALAPKALASAPLDWPIAQLTATPGLEIDPAPSPSGRQVAFSAQAERGQPWLLQVLDVASGQVTPLDTGQPEDHSALGAAWSPDGERLAYIGFGGAGCTIRVTALYPGADRAIAQCRQAQYGRGLAWTPDSSALVFSDRPAADQPYQLFRVNVDTGEQSALTQPPGDWVGDRSPRMSANGDLAFVRSRTLGVEDVYRAAGDAASPMRLTRDSTKVHSLDWLGDGLVMASNRAGGLFGLWWLRGDGSGLARLPAPTGADGPRASASGRMLVFEQWASQVDLVRAPIVGSVVAGAGGEPVPLISSTRWDWAPALSPGGDRIAWLSDRSGAAEVWVAQADGTAPRQLTSFGGPYTQPPAWTADGSALRVSAPVDGVFSLHRVDVVAASQPAEQRVSRIARIQGDASSPLIAPDGSLLYLTERPGSADLMHEDGSLVLEDVRHAEFGADGRLWFCRPRVAGLWVREPDDTVRQVTDQLLPVDALNWWVDADGVYLVIRPEPNAPQLARMSFEGVITTLRPLPGLLYKSGLARVDDDVIYARTIRHDADLFRLGPVAQ